MPSRYSRKIRRSKAYSFRGSVVKDPNNPPKRLTFSTLMHELALTLPKAKTFSELMNMKKPALLAYAKKENIKVWKSWNKTKIANTIIGA